MSLSEQSPLWKNFWNEVVYEKSNCYVVKFRAQKLAAVFQHKLLFKVVKGLFKRIGGLGRSVTVLVQCEGEKVFDIGEIRKKYLIRCQIYCSKTRFAMFQHQLLFNLVKDIFKWIIGLGRSGTLRVQSEGEKFWPRWYTKKFLESLSQFVLKNLLYSAST